MTHTSWIILKREEDMCDERKESLLTNRKKKSSKISRVWARFFYRCFVLKDLIKSIEILLKK